MKETLVRSITGIAFIALVVLSLVLHPATYLVLFGLASAAAWFELDRMFRDSVPRSLGILFACVICGSFILVYFIAGRFLPASWLLVPAGLALILLVVLFTSRPAKDNIPFLTAAVIYLLAGFCGMHFLAFLPGTEAGYSPRWILFTFYLLWMNDTMAYVSGRLAGRHPVWPSVSPSKTWEGILGGALFTLVLALLFSRYYSLLTPLEWAGFALVIILFGSLGDLFESRLKRKAGIKDSGSLLPGHGGVLDRLDSLLLSVPLAALYLNIVL